MHSLWAGSGGYADHEFPSTRGTRHGYPVDRYTDLAASPAHAARHAHAGLGLPHTQQDYVRHVRRFLLHVLPRGFHRIRHYGLLAGTARKASIALARELLDVAAPPDDDTPDEPGDFRPPCLCCGGRMIVIEVFER